MSNTRSANSSGKVPGNTAGKESTASSTSTTPGNTSRFLQCGKRRLDLSRPQVMGILNVTPDSFSDGGRLHDAVGLSLDAVLRKAEQMLADGAAILDVGGESTRPGAVSVSLQEEMDRVLPVVERLAERFDTIVSVDTSSPEIMRQAASSGAGLINDVRALQRPGAVEAAVQAKLPVCLMHMLGQPDTMQQQPHYQYITAEVCAFLVERVACCVAAGLDRQQLLLDPGFGFGKTVQHNLQLLAELPKLAALGHPLLVGLSRKSLLGQLLGRPVDQRLAGSLTLAVLAAERGAAIIRVHDVAETVDAMKLCTALSLTGPAGQSKWSENS